MRLVFGQRQLESNVAVDMAVGQGMNDLAHGPTTFAIGRIELLIAQIAHGFAEIRRMGSDLLHESLALRSVEMRMQVKFADRKAGIGCCRRHEKSIKSAESTFKGTNGLKWLPEFNSIAFRIGEPAKAPEGSFLDLGINI